MGTHPIFESDFDCLTELKMNEAEIVRFLRENGGKVTNTELYLEFKPFIKSGQDKKNFPEFVNKVAFVKKKEVDGKEVKFTYLRKNYKTGPLPGTDAKTPVRETLDNSST